MERWFRRPLRNAGMFCYAETVKGQGGIPDMSFMQERPLVLPGCTYAGISLAGMPSALATPLP